MITSKSEVTAEEKDYIAFVCAQAQIEETLEAKPVITGAVDNSFVMAGAA